MTATNASASHHHHHHGTHAHGTNNRLSLVLCLTALYMVAEAVGGWYAGSLALLADAGHMLTDVAALALALFAAWFSRRPATARKTFGYHRIEILAALINGVTLVVVSLFIFREAYERLMNPAQVESGLMMAIAFGGLCVNLVSAYLLHGSHEENLNLHGAWLHIIGDALGSVAAITAGILIHFYGWYIADPIISVVITLLILWSSWHLIREATNVLLEGTPAHINFAAVEETIRETNGVRDMHDLHVWTITSGRDALSVHVVHAPTATQTELLKTLGAKLHDRFGIDHLTIQLETINAATGLIEPCHAGMPCFESGGQKSVVSGQ
ncbi:MAG: cation diffusion facilitator family transporter [Pyrinomonadaceae bacterium MAG19_C2-C3]|nr:cation diffusion facilitator family transporter [Pyrinomonadaceae bacterium MAG19_C2-C3]